MAPAAEAKASAEQPLHPSREAAAAVQGVQGVGERADEAPAARLDADMMGGGGPAAGTRCRAGVRYSACVEPRESN